MVKSSAVSVKLKTEVTIEDQSKRKDAQDEEEGTKHGALGDTMGDWGSGELAGWEIY